MSEETFQDRVDRERREQKEAYMALFNGVCRYMDGWELHLNPNHEEGWCEENRWSLVPSTTEKLASATDISGQRITMRMDRGKVHVSGYWPQRKGNGPYVTPHDVREESPSINCSLSKGYELIAKDIKRRFLPEYQRIWEVIKAKIAADETYASNKQSNWQRIVAAGVEDFTRDHSAEQRGRIAIKGDGYSDVRMTSKDSVAIELRSIPVDVAITVIKALRGIK